MSPERLAERASETTTVGERLVAGTLHFLCAPLPNRFHLYRPCRAPGRMRGI
jgi:hypothetical protein